MNTIFSIIIPLYNKEKYILKTIEFIFSQTIKDFEIIIVNDGSTDKSVDVVKSIKDCRIKIVNQKHSGVSVARNNGIKKSKSNLIAFIDADDIWEPKFLENILILKNKYKSAKIYSTRYKTMFEDKTFKVSTDNTDNILIRKFFKPYINPIWTSAIVVEKSMFSSISFPEQISSLEDVITWILLSDKTNIALSNYIGATHTFTKESLGATLNIKMLKDTLYDMYNKQLFTKYTLKDIDEFLDNYYINIALFFIKKQNYTMALSSISNIKLNKNMKKKLVSIALNKNKVNLNIGIFDRIKNVMI